MTRAKMWEFEHSEEGVASRSALWALYSDVMTWPEWDKGIEWIRLDGEFREGASGTIKPVGQDQLPFRLTKVTVGGGFSDETEIPGAGVTIGFKHTSNRLAKGGAGSPIAFPYSGPDRRPGAGDWPGDGEGHPRNDAIAVEDGARAARVVRSCKRVFSRGS